VSDFFRRRFPDFNTQLHRMLRAPAATFGLQEIHLGAEAPVVFWHFCPLAEANGKVG